MVYRIEFWWGLLISHVDSVGMGVRERWIA